MTSNGGTGNDVLKGTSGADSIDGGAGNDSLFGDYGDDTLVGGDGNDLQYGGTGSDRFELGSGAGSDTVYGGENAGDEDRLVFISDEAVGITFTAAESGTYTQNAGGTTGTFHEIEQIETGAGNDTINASADTSGTWDSSGAGDDSFTGGSRADTVFGGDGSDTITGGLGHDSLFGGDGNDSLIGNNDTWDEFFGGAGDDTIVAGESWGDYASGGAGNDLISMGAGTDIAIGGMGNDTLYGQDDSDSLFGDAGEDSVFGGQGADLLFGGAGSDTVDGGTESDTIFGATGADSLLGGDGADVLGGDYVVGLSPGDLASKPSGPALDWIVVNNSAVPVDLYWIDESGTSIYFRTVQPDTSVVQPTFEGHNWLIMESGTSDILDVLVYPGGTTTTIDASFNDTLIGGAGADTIFGDLGDDQIYGGAGNDALFGGVGDDSLNGDAGDDLFDGGDGNDVLDGGAGTDRVVFAGSAATYTTGTSGPYLIVTDLAGTQGSDSISGFEQIEFAEGVFDLRTGTAANDTISDTGGLPDFIAAGAGDDTVSGTAAGDVIFGGEGADSIAAAAGNDTVFGDAGNDQIEGNGGDDLVFGGDGNDTLHGGAGNDTLTGGDGADRFALEQAGGGDHVTDFDMTLTAGRTTDQLDVSDLRDLNGNPINAWDVVVTDDGNGNAVLTFPEGESLVLEGVAPRQMATAQQRHAAGIPCFTTGVRILTPAGEIPVERFCPGDLVVTRDNGPMPVVWAGTRRLGAAELATAPHLRPVRIAPGSWAGPRDLLVSPQHAILVRAPQRGGTESFVRATHLARLKGGKVRIAGGCRSVTYVHLLFEGHQVIFANGVASESYYPGKWGITALDHIARHEVLTLFPDLRWRDPAFVYGPTARPVCRFRDLPSDLADLRLDLLGGSAALLRKLA